VCHMLISPYNWLFSDDDEALIDETKRKEIDLFQSRPFDRLGKPCFSKNFSLINMLRTCFLI
jgi:hypothetical protein